MSGEFGTGKTIFVLAIVVGCFAVLWPKIFYPMLTASVKQPASGRQVGWSNEGNVHFLDQLCYLLEEHQLAATGMTGLSGGTSHTGRWTGEDCWRVVFETCGVQLTETLVGEVRMGRDKSNLTNCLAGHYSLSPAIVAASAPPRIRPRPYLPQGMSPHARPERPSHLYPEMMHPALREKGRAMPQRTIDKQARPGPMPGVRPPMGGAGGIVPPPQAKGSGAMGIIMPLYTVGIVVFFVYTIMKVLFKKGQEDDKTPKLRDFGMDPEYRKYVFAEEYLDNNDISTKDQIRRHAREESRSRKKAQAEQQPEAKIEDEQLDQLRRRLEETEKAMERLMCQMGSVTDKLTAAKITEVLSQAQAQAKILKIGLDTVLESAAASAAAAKKKEEVGEMTSEEDLTSSEALTTTLSEETSLPASLQQHLEEIQVEQLSSYSELLAEAGQLPKDVALSLGVSVEGSLPEKGVFTSAFDTLDFQGAPIGATALEEFISGDRTIIQLQELKDDDLPVPEDIKPPDVTMEKEEIASTLEGNVEAALPAEEPENIEQLVEELGPQAFEPQEEKDEGIESKPEGIPDIIETMQSSPVEQTVSDIGNKDATSPACENEVTVEVPEDEVIKPKTSTPVETAPEPVSPSPASPVHEQSGEGTEDGSSEATETGADISDLCSFAEENQATGHVASKESADVDAAAAQKTTEMNQLCEDLDVESESVCKGQGTQTSFAFALPTPAADSKEYGTQTEREQGVAVLGLNTSFRHDEGGVETKAGSQGPVSSHEVTEILLDALLPSETQLLVRDAQVVGSSPMQNIEIEASETGAIPCIVTSNVSLAFLGLEQREDITPSPTNNSTLVAEERAPDIAQEETKEVPLKEPLDMQIVVPPSETDIEPESCDLLPSVTTIPEQSDLPVCTSLPEVIAELKSSDLSSTIQSIVNDTLNQTELVAPVMEAVKQPESVLPNLESVVLPETVVPVGIPLDSMACEPSADKDMTNSHLSEASLQQAELRESLPCEVSPPCEAGVDEKVDQTLEMPMKLVQELDVASTEFDNCRDVEKLDDINTNSPNVVLEESFSDVQPSIEKVMSFSEERVGDDEEIANQLNAKVELTVDDALGKPLNEVLPRPSSPLPPHIPDEDKETHLEEREYEQVVPQIPVSPSLEAIAEAVAAATTRAALDLLATTSVDAFKPLEEAQTMTKSTFFIEEVSSDQSPVSTDESSTATTVVAVSDTEDTETPDAQSQSKEKALTNGSSPSDASTMYVATVSHTPSGSPSSTPEVELSGEAVEAALAEAAQEEVPSSSMTKSLLHEKSATQEGSGATTASPKNEESPTSSKGSSPDMDEYEVITKEEDHANNSAKEKLSREETTSMKSGTKKVQPTVQDTEEDEVAEEKEEDEEEPENEDEEEFEVGEEEVQNKSNDPKNRIADLSHKDSSAKTACETEESDDE